MKTNVIMYRPMGEFTVQQRTVDGYFNATTLIEQWNVSSGQKKKIDHFFENKSTDEFVQEIMRQENLDTRNSVYVKSRARSDRGGGTWMHPLLFIDFAMWLNPKFKYQVLKFVHDELIKYRNDSGDSYKAMCSVLYSKFKSPDEFRDFITESAVTIRRRLGVLDWSNATEVQLKARDKIHEIMIMLADVVPLILLVDTSIKKYVQMNIKK